MKTRFIKFALASVLLGSTLVACKEETNEACTEHSWDAGVITVPPTENSDGLMTYTCTVCKETKTTVINKTGTSTCEHSWNAGEITTLPTTTSDGVKEFTCTKCGSKKYEIIPKAGEETKFTVSYNANGGTGSGLVDLNEYKSGDRVTVKNNTFVAPEGKEFINWNEEADGSGSYHNAGSTFKIYENITLYAQWDDVELPEDGEHMIKVNAPTGVTYKLSKTKAVEGEEITLTLTLAAGIALNGEPTSSDVTLTKESSTVYKFTMPDKFVNIYIKATIDGDAVINGDINARLLDNDGDGIYTAEVDCTNNNSYDFTLVVKDDQGNPRRLDSNDVDETKCNASIHLCSSKENELTIDGGFIYVFYYDSNLPKFNYYVTRKTANFMPKNNTELSKLFDGERNYRSNTSIHPEGLTSITYEKRVNGTDTTQGYQVTNEKYTYKKISDTESFATSVNTANNKTGYVYENIDTVNNVYSIVNTYELHDGNNEQSDNAWPVDPYKVLQENEAGFAFSAKQDIVSNDNFGETSRYTITEREAYRNVSMSAHYGSALEYEIWEAIRGDYDFKVIMNGAVHDPAATHIAITSNKVAGGFRTTLDSQLEYNAEATGDSGEVTRQYAFMYHADFAFKSNGDLYSLQYEENYYTKNNWDFVNHAPKANAVPITTTINLTNGFNETFERSNVLGNFNPDDYFISSIDKLSFYNNKGGAKDPNVSVMNYDDSLDIIEYKNGGKLNPVVDEFKYSPATALDMWQYGFVATSDKGVADDTAHGPKTVGEGTATVTFGNHLKNMQGPTKDVPISVYANGTFSMLFINCNITGYDSYNDTSRDEITGYAGATMKYYVDSSSNTGCPISYWIVYKGHDDMGDYYYDDCEYFTVENSVGTYHYSNGRVDLNCDKMVGHDLILNFNTPAANALTSEVKVRFEMRSDRYEAGRSSLTFELTIRPPLEPIANSKYSATYPYTDDPTLTNTVATVQFNADNTGKITETLYKRDGSESFTNTYFFSYTVANNFSIQAHITSVDIQDGESPTSPYSYKLEFIRTKTDVLGVLLVADGVPIFGTYLEDEEGYVEDSGGDPFERVTQ